MAFGLALVYFFSLAKKVIVVFFKVFDFSKRFLEGTVLLPVNIVFGVKLAKFFRKMEIEDDYEDIHIRRNVNHTNLWQVWAEYFQRKLQSIYETKLTRRASRKNLIDHKHIFKFKENLFLILDFCKTKCCEP